MTYTIGQYLLTDYYYCVPEGMKAGCMEMDERTGVGDRCVWSARCCAHEKRHGGKGRYSVIACRWKKADLSPARAPFSTINTTAAATASLPLCPRLLQYYLFRGGKRLFRAGGSLFSIFDIGGDDNNLCLPVARRGGLRAGWKDSY